MCLKIISEKKNILGTLRRVQNLHIEIRISYYL